MTAYDFEGNDWDEITEGEKRGIVQRLVDSRDALSDDYEALVAEHDLCVALPDDGREGLHETHVCRDCGAEITLPFVRADSGREGLRAAAQRFVDAAEACRVQSEAAIEAKGAATAFEEGFDPLSIALVEFGEAEDALRAALSPDEPGETHEEPR